MRCIEIIVPSQMTNIGKSLIIRTIAISRITLIFLDCRHSQLVIGSWMRRGAIVHLIIVCFDNPENFISLSTSTLCLILIVDRLVGRGVRIFVTTFLCHIFDVESVRSMPLMSFIHLLLAHFEGLNTFDKFGARRHMRAGSRHV